MIKNLSYRRKKCFLCYSKTIKKVKEKLYLYHFGEKMIEYGICKKCGLVLQTLGPTKREVTQFYKKNFYFEDFKKPNLDKIISIKRQINHIKQECNIFPRSILEVSLMSTYNLRLMQKEGASILHGIEPSLVISKKFKKNSKIKVFPKTIENFNSKIKYDLIMMSHVLEHLNDPSLALKKCYKIQKKGQKIFVEVPLFEKTNLYPPSGLNVEHIYYFNESTLKNLIESNGYEILSVNKIYESTQLPFISIVAEKRGKVKKTKLDLKNYKIQEKEIFVYCNTIKKIYNKVDTVLNRMTKKENTYILGTGFTASCFLFYSKKIKKIKLKGIFDNSSEKESKEFLNFKIQKPNYDKLMNGSNIIVATIGSVKEIMKNISKPNKNRLNFYVFDEKYNFVKV